MMEILIKCNSGYQNYWNSFLKEWGKESDDLPLYIALNEYALDIINKVESNKSEEIKKIFTNIEYLIKNGDEYVKTAMVVGLLEDLQNKNLHKNTQPRDLEAYLREESKKSWDELYVFWDK